MDLLRTLQNQIETLRSDPTSVDVGSLVDLLSQAYELARDGLNRSQNASKYIKAQELIDELKPQIESLQTKNKSLNKVIEQAEADLEAMKIFADDLRQRTIGMVSLCAYSAEVKKIHSAKLETCGYSELVELVAVVRDEFKRTFGEKKETLVSNDQIYINPKLYAL